MEKQMQNSYARTAKQVEEMCRLYSKIGQPLPVNIIIDLHHHLGKALDMEAQTRPRPLGKKKRLQV